jgi:hypothetical protein
MTTRLRAGLSRFDSQKGNEGTSLRHRVQISSGARQLPIQRVPGALSLAVKRPEREADYSPTSSADVKDAWS